MRLFSYVVARDFGFAPNPFGGSCTLATCKPLIRSTASVGDWVTGLAGRRDATQPRIVYIMQVAEALSFDAYWADARFKQKIPSRYSGLKRAFGDNIYHRRADGQWLQADSHHSLADGSPNYNNITVDTRVNRVLIATRFAYWGSNAMVVPQRFLNHNGETLSVARGHRSQFSDSFINGFVEWYEGLSVQGYLGQPFRWA